METKKNRTNSKETSKSRRWGCLYVMTQAISEQAGCKIGRSGLEMEKVEKRWKQLSAANHMTIRRIVAVDDVVAAEKLMHDIFASARITHRKEWFGPIKPRSVCAAIKAVSAMYNGYKPNGAESLIKKSDKEAQRYRKPEEQDTAWENDWKSHPLKTEDTMTDREDRIARGLCVSCPVDDIKSAIPDQTRCETCAAKVRAYSRKRKGKQS